MAKRLWRHIIWLWMGLAVLILLIFVLGMMFIGEMQVPQRQSTLARILAPGRTRSEIERRLGLPTRVEVNARIGKRQFPSILIYKSRIGGLVGSEDIWIALDEKEQIMAVYYPDYPQDREIIEGAGSLPGS